MNMKNLYLICFLLFILNSITTAQDVHFTQFSQSPLNLNPAAAGVFYGDYRLATDYRTQWSPLGNPYSTISASYDMKLFKRRLYGNYFGVGILFNKDNAGAGAFGTTQVNLALSFNKTLNADENHFISVGIQYGYAQRSINFANFSWDKQWDQEAGAYNPNLNSYETTPNSSFWYSDLSAGLMWHYNPSEMYKFTFGLGMDHINQPAINIYTNGADNLYKRYLVHTTDYFAMGQSATLYLVPSILYTWQGPAKEFDVGTYLMYILTDRSRYTKFVGEIDLSFGLFLRKGDAVCPAIKVGFRNLAIGLSYDVNTSALNQATNGSGAYEISLIYANRITKSHFRRGAPKATRFL